MSTDMTITPEEIRALRGSLGLTQGELAQRLCLSREAITHWETGRSNPSGPAEMLLRQMQVEAETATPPISGDSEISSPSPAETA